MMIDLLFMVHDDRVDEWCPNMIERFNIGEVLLKVFELQVEGLCRERLSSVVGLPHALS